MLRFSIILSIFSFFVFPKSAYAYLDPGSGSMILQLLLAGLAGAFVVLKLFWHRVLALFGISKEKKGDTGSDQS